MLKKGLLSLAIGWTAVIAVLCLVSFNDLPSIGVSGIDKIVHIGFYFILIMLWGFYFSLRQKEIKLTVTLSLIGLSVCYGILIEILQETLTATRHADLFDVLANTAGAILAFLLFVYIKSRKASKHLK